MRRQVDAANRVAVSAAGSLAERHALRALDALQLASFVSLRRRLPRRGIAFSSFDRRLTGAARRARWPLR